MDYETLMEKYRSKEVFIYGRSVVRIVEKKTYVDAGTRKTDFVFQTDRNHRGIITVPNENKDNVKDSN